MIKFSDRNWFLPAVGLASVVGAFVAVSVWTGPQKPAVSRVNQRVVARVELKKRGELNERLELNELNAAALRRLTIADLTNEGQWMLGLRDFGDARLGKIHLNELRDEYLRQVPATALRESALDKVKMANKHVKRAPRTVARAKPRRAVVHRTVKPQRRYVITRVYTVTPTVVVVEQKPGKIRRFGMKIKRFFRDMFDSD